MLTTDRTTTRKLMTADEAAQLSSLNHRFELVKGVYIELSPASALHGVVAITIGSMLNEFVRKYGRGRVTAAETGFILAQNPENKRDF